MGPCNTTAAARDISSYLLQDGGTISSLENLQAISGIIGSVPSSQVTAVIGSSSSGDLGSNLEKGAAAFFNLAVAGSAANVVNEDAPTYLEALQSYANQVGPQGAKIALTCLLDLSRCLQGEPERLDIGRFRSEPAAEEYANGPDSAYYGPLGDLDDSLGVEVLEGGPSAEAAVSGLGIETVGGESIAGVIGTALAAEAGE